MHCRLTPAVRIGGRTGFQSGVRELVSSPSDPESAAKQILEIGCEEIVASVDCMAYVAKELHGVRCERDERGKLGFPNAACKHV
jgi:hypothetical protein